MKFPLAQRLVKITIRLQEKIIYFLENRNNKNKKIEAREERVPLSGEALNLDSVREQDRGTHVKYYDTENSQMAKGAEKEPGHGIDKFGEKDTFDPDEADEHQTNRDRNQNSDLSKRFYTDGLDLDKI